jgi:hypothetical protein
MRTNSRARSQMRKASENHVPMQFVSGHQGHRSEIRRRILRTAADIKTVRIPARADGMSRRNNRQNRCRGYEEGKGHENGPQAESSCHGAPLSSIRRPAASTEDGAVRPTAKVRIAMIRHSIDKRRTRCVMRKRMDYNQIGMQSAKFVRFRAQTARKIHLAFSGAPDRWAPASTMMTSPVTLPAPSSSHTATSAISSGVPAWRSGVVCSWLFFKLL